MGKKEGIPSASLNSPRQGWIFSLTKLLRETAFAVFAILKRLWKRPIPPVTKLLLGTTFAVFAIQIIVYYLQGSDLVGEHLAFSPMSWAAHRYSTLLSYAWAHAVHMPGLPALFWIHILTNMMLLYSLGPSLEECLGKWRFLGLYLGGAISAALTWLCFSAHPGESVIGASGAAFALIGAAGTLEPRMKVRVLILFLVLVRMPLGLLLFTFCAIEAVSLIFGWMPFVGHWAHLGGAAFGCLYCLGLRTIRRRKIAI